MDLSGVEGCPECDSLPVAYFYGSLTNCVGPFVKVSSHTVGAMRKEDLETECITNYWVVKVEHGDKGSDESIHLAPRWLTDSAMAPLQTC